MKIDVLADAETVAKRAAAVIAEEARATVAANGRFCFALSGGRTPWMMLQALVDEDVPWDSVHLIQVDERIAPAGHPDRNLTHIQENLLSRVKLRPDQMHAMPVDASNLHAEAESYSRTLMTVCGLPPILDLIHLGLGPDGHTASLVPEDPTLRIHHSDVAITGPYQGRQRMTLTYPMINRSRRILWVVTGDEKAGPLARLSNGDHSIPAGRIDRDRSFVLADRAAASQLSASSQTP